MIRVGFIFLVPTADVRYVLLSLQFYSVIPASQNTLVLAAWINFKVGIPKLQKIPNNLILIPNLSFHTLHFKHIQTLL